MVDCDYCDASFDDEEAYLEHLASEHEGELSRIDQKRVDQATGEDNQQTMKLFIGVGVVLLLAGVAYVTFFSGSDVSGIEGEPLPDQGNQTLLQDVESFDDVSKGHVDKGTTVNYDHVPPTGGDHWPASETVQPGFYQSEQPYEALVHNLEHGHVVIYYDSDNLSSSAEESLTEFATVHTGSQTSVVVVPNPEDDPKSNYVMTAWGHRLRMDDYDAKTVRAFIAEYLGRGPEGQPAR